MTWIANPVANVDVVQSLHRLVDVLERSRILPSLDHLRLISGTNIISVAVPEI